MNDLVARVPVEMIVKYRDMTLAKYAEAFEKIVEANAVIDEARALWKLAAPTDSAHYFEGHDEIRHFHAALVLPDRDRYLRVARKLVDCSVWSHIVETTGIERLMDKQEKDRLREQMKYVPDRVSRDGQIITEDEAAKGLPEISVGNIAATLERFLLDSDMIFRRGLANAFSKLDRRFRSHGGFCFEDRVVLTRAFDDYGQWNHYTHHRDTIVDIERALQILDGRSPLANYGGICWIVDQERQGTCNPKQSVHHGEFFRIRIFKNGNAHLWFTRKDVLEKANKVLAEWYGEVIGDANNPEEDPFNNVKMTPARNFGFFPTPDDVADQLLDPRSSRGASLSFIRPAGSPPIKVLEPSAGTGNLARRAAAKDLPNPDEYFTKLGKQQRVTVDCVEIQPDLAANLEAEGIYNRVICGDFLTMKPDASYDIIIMNPPFDRERDIDHVVHALKFLKPGGQLTAIMSAGTEFRSTAKAKAFRDLMQSMSATWADLPPGSFSSVGTNVNTVIVSIRSKP